MRRWLVPVLAAAAVLVVLAGLWWTAGPGPGGDETSFAGGDTGVRSGGDGGGSDGFTGDGSVGGAEPTSPGDGEPGFEEPGSPGDGTPADGSLVAPPTDEPVTDPLAVVVDSYHRYDERHLAISYTIGVPECYGTIAAPDVVETRRAVTVTLTRVPPEDTGDVACIDIALLASVDIELAAPLGDRVVRDGARGTKVPPGPPPGEVGEY